ncbi:MAG: transglutaminase-like protein [Rhodobacteraceae bacterium HLUCCA08]|nr:MAG: transglutaminase-like protein [Rhodobacteraceae bacterium HLUCCA08]
MTEFSITYEADLPDGARALVPGGLTTPQARCLGVDSAGPVLDQLTEAHTGQVAHVVGGAEGRLELRFTFDDTGGDAYPEAIFRPRDSRFTRFADALRAEAAEIAPHAPPAERARAIACATADRFTYGHPEARFNDGMDAVPALGCGLTEGSCVDINTYFIAALRAAGIEAGYVTGFHFPAEKGDRCEDGHCWVVTRTEAGVQEWDIAHHLKMGTRDIHPGLNPKPGFRAAGFHSMGLGFARLDLPELKALIEPLHLTEDGPCAFDDPRIRLHHPAVAEPAPA